IEIAAYSSLSTLVLCYLYHELSFPMPPKNLTDRTKATIWKLIRMLPPVKKRIEKELSEAMVSMEESFVSNDPNEKFTLQLPFEGRSAEEIIEDLKYLQTSECDINNGKASGAVYHDGNE